MRDGEYGDYTKKLEETKIRIREEFFADGMTTIMTQTAHVFTLKFRLCEEKYLQAQ